MGSNVGKKHIAHKGSGHGCVGPGAISPVTPPAPPAPTPFVYTAQASNAKGTTTKMKVGKKPVLIEGSTMSLDPPANQPAQSGGGDAVTHATKNEAVMTMGSICLLANGKGVCATGDLAAMNVLNSKSKVAQLTVPLLEAGDFDTARKSVGAAAAMNKKYKAAFPPPKANQTTAGHPVDIGTGYVVDDGVDLSLPGFVPLVWSRSYSSASPSRRGALGTGGWTHAFEQRVEISETGYRLWDDEGLPVDFAASSGPSFHRGRQLELRIDGARVFVRSIRDRHTRIFEGASAAGPFRLTAIRNDRGRAITLGYDEGDRLVLVTDSVGRELRIQNDGEGRVLRVEVWASDPEPRDPAPPRDAPPPRLALATWFTYAYHPEGELASRTDALGRAEGWDYDGLHRMVRAGLANGVSFHYAYDEDTGVCVRTWGDGGLHDVRLDVDPEAGETRTHATNRARRYVVERGLVVREETFSDDWSEERKYDDDDLLVELVNGLGEKTTYVYDARGHIVARVDAAGNETRFVVENDRVTACIDADGNTWRQAFDAYGGLVGMTYPSGEAFSIERDRDGQLASFADRDGVRRRLRYDAHGNLETESNARGATTRYTFDALGRVTSRTDPLGRRTTVAYDAAGQIVERVTPDGATTRFGHDRLGNLSLVVDATGRTTRIESSGTGVTSRVTLADGQSYTFFYDSDERLVRILNPRLESHEIESDRADRVVAERTFDGRSLAYRYDRAGRVVRVEAPDGEYRELAYDKLGNVLENRGADVQLTFERDAQGRLDRSTATDVTATVVTEHERDAFGRVTADIQNGRAVRYVYDEKGRIAERLLPNGVRTAFAYDEGDALVGVTHDRLRLTLDRDPLGREIRRQVGAFAIETAYDARDRIAATRAIRAPLGAPTGAPFIERQFTYDATGRPIAVASPDGDARFTYDAVDRLVDATTRAAHEIFSYDPVGSLTGRLEGGDPPWSLAPGNVLLQAGKRRFLYDGKRRRIQEKQGDKATVYGWDSLDRLREIVLADGTRVRFTYDALGRRVRKDVLGPADAAAIILEGQTVERRSVAFLWDGLTLAEERNPRSPTDDGVQRVHVHAPGTWVPLLQIDRGAPYAVVTDPLGAPRELVDVDGRVAWRATPRAWGDVTQASRDRGAALVASPFRMLGHYADVETGLTSTLFRYFEAETGRWLSPDPIGLEGGYNLHGFNAAPTFRTDPLGLCAKELQDIVNRAYAKLINDPKAVRRRLTADEKAVVQEKGKGWLRRVFFGTALEREVDAMVKKEGGLGHGVEGKSGGGPDYAGGGMTFELTSSHPSTVETHANRPNAAQDGMVTYPPLTNDQVFGNKKNGTSPVF